MKAKIGVIAGILTIGLIFSSCSTSGTVKTQGDDLKDQNHYNTLLLRYGNFKKTSQDNVKLRFDFTNGQFSVLKNKYELDKVAGNGNDLSKALNILYWLCEHTYHKGDYDNHVPMNSLDLLEYSFDTGESGGINCLNLSYILTECLLSIGLPAHTVRILPFSHEDTDNHVVTHVYIKSTNKWLMLGQM